MFFNSPHVFTPINHILAIMSSIIELHSHIQKIGIKKISCLLVGKILFDIDLQGPHQVVKQSIIIYLFSALAFALISFQLSPCSNFIP